jgi:hypothetical protein
MRRMLGFIHSAHAMPVGYCATRAERVKAYGRITMLFDTDTQNHNNRQNKASTSQVGLMEATAGHQICLN